MDNDKQATILIPEEVDIDRLPITVDIYSSRLEWLRND